MTKGRRMWRRMQRTRIGGLMESPADCSFFAFVRAMINQVVGGVVVIASENN